MPINVANRALLRIGHTELVSDLGSEETDGEQSLAADVARQHLDALRQQVLEAHPWYFATKRAVLAPVAGASRTDWGFVYARPVDCLYARGIVRPGLRNPAAADLAPYAQEADGEVVVILCDEPQAELLYTVDQKNLDVWIQRAVSGYVLLMAAEYALAIRKEPRLALALREEAGVELRVAAAISANQRQAPAPQLPPALRVRGG